MIGEYGYVIYQYGEFAGTCNTWEEVQRICSRNEGYDYEAINSKEQLMELIHHDEGNIKRSSSYIDSASLPF